MPFFLNPFAFAGLAAVPILIGIYYLRNRFKREVVSSLVLWDSIIKSNEGGQKKDRLQLPWLFFLELLGLIALAFAATQPFFKTTSQRIPVTVLLDDSFSMLAIPDDDDAATPISIREKGLEELRNMLRTGVYEFDLLLAGLDARRLGQKEVQTVEQLDEIITDWQCQQNNCEIYSAIDMVRKMHGPNRRILVLTDHPPLLSGIAEDPVLKWLAMGKPSNNLAITYAARKTNRGEDNDHEKLLVRIENFSPDTESKSLNSSLTIRDSNTKTELISNDFTISSNSKKEVSLELPIEMAEKDLTIEIENDALMADNSLILLATQPLEINVSISISDSRMLRAWREALQVIPDVSINAKPASQSDLVITDTDYLPKPEQWHIHCPPQKNPTAFSGPFAASREHPLCNGLPLQGAIWAANRSTTAAQSPDNSRSSGEPEAKQNSDENGRDEASVPEAPRAKKALALSVIGAGQTPLVTDLELSKLRRRITINLQPEFSTISISPPTWIVLVVNLIEWRRTFGHGPMQTNTWQNQQTLRFPLGVRIAQVTSPSGQQSDIPVIGGVAQYETFENGVWDVESTVENSENDASENDVSGVKLKWRWSFFGLSAEESNLKNLDSESIDNWQDLDVELRDVFQPFAWLFGLLALLMISAGLLFQKTGSGGVQ